MQADEKALDTDTLIVRREKLKTLRKKGWVYPNDFRPDAKAAELHKQYDHFDNESLKAKEISVKVAGRIMLRRVMGKATFMQLQDSSGAMQIYCRQDELPELYEQIITWDLGDIIGVQGFLFKTKTNELTIHAKQLFLIVKSLRPLPDKFHGLHDQELRYRQRYLDLITSEKTRNIFKVRAQIIHYLREFLLQHQYIEVETPMMHHVPGGALARPFITHHNTLKMDLYLRIAPELYLKKLLIGGFDRVFEINRNFRNEGLSTQHNPEFTTVEFYQAYADYRDLIKLTENLFRYLAEKILGKTTLQYQGHEIDFGKPFAQYTLKEAVLHFNPHIKLSDLEDIQKALKIAEEAGVNLKTKDITLGKLQLEIFEKTVEHHLQQPTFITQYPVEVSPLARNNEQQPKFVDRFELYIGGREIANAFSELNDPEEQAERFRLQALEKAAGDMEAMQYDEDFVEALEYGMPPAAGEGIGLDRLVMLFTDSATIRDVILFPLLRPNQGND